MVLTHPSPCVRMTQLADNRLLTKPLREIYISGMKAGDERTSHGLVHFDRCGEKLPTIRTPN